MDEQDGVFIEFHQNGKKAAQGEFRNKMKNGIWSKWDPNGKLYYQVEFKNNKQVRVLVKPDQPKE